MGSVTTQLESRAASIFTDLGYTVSRNGAGLRAERKWRVVEITPIDDPVDPPRDGGLRCFVTWSDRVSELERTLDGSDLDCEWALIGVDDSGNYEVVRAPSVH
jgi:hypothetical protein